MAKRTTDPEPEPERPADTFTELLNMPPFDPAKPDSSIYLRLRELFGVLFEVLYRRVEGAWICAIRGQVPLFDGSLTQVTREGVGPTPYLAYEDAADAWGLFGMHPRPKHGIKAEPTKAAPPPATRPASSAHKFTGPRQAPARNGGKPSDDERMENGWISAGKERVIWAKCKAHGIEFARAAKLAEESYGADKVYKLSFKKFKDFLADLDAMAKGQEPDEINSDDEGEGY